MTWHYLMQGDCLDRMQEIPNGYVDLIICDLPYGTTACKWDVIIPFDKLWKQYRRICKGAVVLTASQPFTSLLITSAIDLFSYEIIWQKERPTNFMQGKKQILKYHENICVFAKRSKTYNPQMVPKPEKNKRNNKPRGATNQIYGDSLDGTKYSERTVAGGIAEENYPGSVQMFSMQRGLHPTQKPIKLMEFLIKTYSNENEVVLDNCMGSGTTGVACINTNRNFVGIEKEESYFSIATNRINDAKKAKETA